MSLETDYPYLTIMHPAHLEYFHRVPLNTMTFFLEILDKLDAQERHEIMYGAFLAVIESVETAQGIQRKTEKVAVSYDAFKKVCKTLPWGIGTLLIISTVHLALSTLFSASDTTSVEDDKNRLVEFAEFAMRNPPPREQAEEDDKFMKWLVEHIENLPETKTKNHKQYVYFCENVVQPLLNEKPRL
jgi:hypothetical protein